MQPERMQDDATRTQGLKDRRIGIRQREVLYRRLRGNPQRLTTPGAVYNAEHRRKWRWTAESGADTDNREGGTRAKTEDFSYSPL